MNKNVSQIVLLFAKCLDFFIYTQMFRKKKLLFVYIKMCKLSFVDGSYCYLHLYIKSLFARKFHVHKNKNKQSFLRKE